MATAKTPKPPTAAKPAVKAPIAVKKTATRPAAAAKPPEDEIVHSVEVAADTTVQTTEGLAETIAQTLETAAIEAPAALVPPATMAEIHQTGAEMLSRGVGPLLDFNRENAILLVSTGNDLALGLHKLTQSLLDWSAESCDKGVAAGQAMLSARSVEEVMDLSRSLARDGIEQMLKESSALSSLSTQLFETTLAALPGRFAAAVEKLTSPAA